MQWIELKLRWWGSLGKPYLHVLCHDWFSRWVWGRRKIRYRGHPLPTRVGCCRQRCKAFRWSLRPALIIKSEEDWADDFRSKKCGRRLSRAYLCIFDSYLQPPEYFVCWTSIPRDIGVPQICQSLWMFAEEYAQLDVSLSPLIKCKICVHSTWHPSPTMTTTPQSTMTRE